MSKKHTKRALLTSVLALVLCVAMLAGATFAWFTDQATTSLNTITAGTLGIELQDAEGKEISNTLSFTNKNNETGILWEPGVTFKLPVIQIVNTGSLALKYKVTFEGLGETKDLADVLDVRLYDDEYKTYTKVGTLSDLVAASTADLDGAAHGVLLPGTVQSLPTGADANVVKIGTTGNLYIALHMQEEAGNQYQGATIDSVKIDVVATQYTYEYDSFNNQYDKDAIYPTVVTNAAELNDAIQNVEDGGTVKLEPGTYTIDTINLGDKSVNIEGQDGVELTRGNDEGAITIRGSKDAVLTINNVTIKGTVNNDGSRGVCFSGQQNENATLIISNSKFENLHTGIFLGGVANATITNCTFTNCGAGIGGTEHLTGTLTVDSCTFSQNGENIGWAGTGTLVIKNSPTCESFQAYAPNTVGPVPVTGGNYTNK